MPYDQQNPDHPPRNRLETPLDVPQIEVTDAVGTVSTSPNSVVGCVIWGASGEQPRDIHGNPVDSVEYMGRDYKVFNPLELTPRPEVPSFLSGEPSVRYVADDVAVDLTPDELLRFMAHELTRAEYLALRDHFGDFWEIRDGRYDPDSGLSLGTMRNFFGDEPQAAALHRPAP